MQSTKPESILQILHLVRAGLVSGLLSKEGVIDWADNIITSDGKPDIFFIDLALSSSKSVNDVIHHFNEYLNFEASAISGRPLLGLLYKQLSNKELTLEQTVRRLYRLKFEVIFSEKEESYIYSIDDSFDCAKHNIHGTFEDVYAELEKFLDFYKGYSIDNYEQWQEMDLAVEIKLDEVQQEQEIKEELMKPWWKIW